MDYFGAYRYLFTSPRWGMNLLLISIAQVIPIFGPMAVMGYVAEMIAVLSKDRRAPCPDFQLDRIADYLVWGLWPLLASLIVAGLGAVLGGLAFLPAFLAGMAGLGDGLAIVLQLLGMAIFGIAIILISFLTLPLMFATLKAREFAPAFQQDYLISFLSTSWLEIILVWLFLMVTGFPLMIAGMLFFCVGIYPASALVTVATWLLIFQVYERHLVKGGQPILKSDPQPDWI